MTESGEMIEMQRRALGGLSLQRISCLGRPVMASIPPRTFEPAAAQAGRDGAVCELPVPPPSAARILERKVIAAVNRDEQAPIFDMADFSIVGDLYDVAPIILEDLKGR